MLCSVGVLSCRDNGSGNSENNAPIINDQAFEAAEDTITILNTYVDNLEIKNDKLDLTALLRKLYDEALQVS